MCYCSVLKQVEAGDLSASIHAVLELVDNVVSKDVKLKKELDYTIKRKSLEKGPRKSPRKDPVTKNSATVNSATVDSATVDSATVDLATVDSATVDSATVDSATVNSATVNLAVGKLGQLGNTDTRLSKIFKYNPGEFGTDLLLNGKCKEWLQDPSSFLKFDQTPHDNLTNNPQHSAIISIRKLEEQDTHSRILRRLYCIVFSRFRELDNHEDAETIAKALYGSYYPGQSLCEEKLKKLTARIRKIEIAGQIYDNLAQVFCPGAIFLLGDDVCNST